MNFFCAMSYPMIFPSSLSSNWIQKPITWRRSLRKTQPTRKPLWHIGTEILADETTINQTILFNGQVAGSVSSYEEEGKPEVTYWLGKEYWGKGIATWALTEFLTHHNKTRPIYARVAKDNLGSRRVLEKCGFAIIGESKGFANARGQEIEEFLLELVE